MFILNEKPSVANHFLAELSSKTEPASGVIWSDWANY
jgi:hypothetical protein